VNRPDSTPGLAVGPGVASAFAAARDGMDALLRDRGLRRTAPDLTTESLLRGAYASAVLAGSVSSAEEVRDGGGDPTSAAAVRLSVGLLRWAPRLATSPRQVLAQLHLRAAVGAESETAGRPRDAHDVARLGHLVGLLAHGQGSGLLIAALAHAEMVTIAPFQSHNGLVARALERLVLVARGVDPLSVTVPEAGHLAMRADYEAALAAYADGEQVAIDGWLRYAAAAYTAGAEASPLAGM
jgi:hypothetical protein